MKLKFHKKKKGQFFLLATVLLCVLFFVGLHFSYPSTKVITQTFSDDMNYLYENMKKEFPHTLNLGLNDSNPVEHLTNFSIFTKRIMNEHYTNLSLLWLITENSSSSDLNITAGNFLDHPTIVILNISGDIKNISVNVNSTNSTIFYSIPSQFNMSVRFNSEESKLLLERDKVNLYTFLKLERRERLLKGAINA
jgi:hypothetical protein